jgi:hypothetical protein
MQSSLRLLTGRLRRPNEKFRAVLIQFRFSPSAASSERLSAIWTPTGKSSNRFHTCTEIIYRHKIYGTEAERMVKLFKSHRRIQFGRAMMDIRTITH